LPLASLSSKLSCQLPDILEDPLSVLGRGLVWLFHIMVLSKMIGHCDDAANNPLLGDTG